MRALSHREDGCGFRPRHPVVAMLDFVGVCTALIAYAYRPDALHALLPYAVASQYAASCVYHWLPYHHIRQAADHVLIAVLISATYVQFWLIALPYEEASGRIVVMTVFTMLVVTTRLALPTHGVLRGMLYAALTLTGLALFVWSNHTLPTHLWIAFLVGVGLYGAQFLVFVAEQPDLVPEVFGYRELQHIILLMASSLHLAIIAIYA